MAAAGAGISVVVPTYNSTRTLPELVNRLHPVLESLAADFELILVDDASPEETWAVIEDLARRNDWVRGVHLMRNYGQHNALLCGIRMARYETTVTMDDDLQHPPEELPVLAHALTGGVDVVYGTPLTEQHGLFRDLASQITKIALQSSMGAPIARKAGAFRMFRTRLRDAFAAYDAPYVSIDVLLSWGTTRFEAVNVRHEPRKLGKSNYTFRKLLLHALNMLTGFSTWPLQAASIIGFAFTIIGTSLLLFVVGRYLLYGGVVPGFSFLASMIAIFSGAQLFALGIMGEYLARIHLRSMQRPPYTIGERTEYEEGAKPGVEGAALVAAGRSGSRR